MDEFATGVYENEIVQLVSTNRILMGIIEMTRYISPNDISAWLLEHDK